MVTETKRRSQPSRRAKKKKKIGISKRFAQIARITFSVLLIAAVLFGGGFFVYSVATIPPYDPGKLDFDATSKVYDINGELIANLHGEENRTPVSLDRIPWELQKAVLAMEDNRFYEHHGFDFRGITRALFRTLTGRRLEGGSTITNQVAKMAFLVEDRKLSRKIQEVFVSLRLEKDYTKDEILEFYLNRLFMGGSAYGMQEAAMYYFGKDVSELNLAESAMLAGIIPAPNYYSPYVSMERAKNKQKETLNNMVRFGYISEEERQAALEQPIVLANRSQKNKTNASSYFVSYVRDQVIKILQDKGYSLREAQQKVFTGGLTINTTLDLRMQRAAEQGMEEILNRYLVSKLANKEERNAQGILQPQCAVILLDVKTGGVRAMIGGREPANDKHNRAVQLLKQQPGSAIKPLTVFGPAIESGKFTAASIIVDEPIYENGPENPPYPVNYSGTYAGPVTLRYAIQQSLNVPAWKIGKENGITSMIEFAKRLGITTLVEKPIDGHDDRNLAALAIGGLTHGVIPIEMAQAFSAIANKGVLNETFTISSIIDSRGQVIYEYRPQQKVVLSEEVAFILNSLLENPVNHGTASSVRSLGGYHGPAAGKTGTTSYNREVWFAGYTPDIAAAIYIGHDSNTTGYKAGDGGYGRLLPEGSSSYITSAMFGKIMSNIYAQMPAPTEFYSSMPENVVKLAIDRKTGLLAGPDCPGENIIEEYFIVGTEPQEVCSAHSQPVLPEEPIEEPGDEISPEEPGLEDPQQPLDPDDANPGEDEPNIEPNG